MMLSLVPRYRSLLAASLFSLVVLGSTAGAVFQTTHGTWFESLAKSCTNTTSCFLTAFTAVPVGRTHIARTVSCRIWVPNNAVVTGLYITGNLGTTWLDVGPPQTVWSTRKDYYVTLEISTPFKTGQVPNIALSSSVAGAMNMNCTLSGDVKL